MLAIIELAEIGIANGVSPQVLLERQEALTQLQARSVAAQREVSILRRAQAARGTIPSMLLNTIPSWLQNRIDGTERRLQVALAALKRLNADVVVAGAHIEHVNEILHAIESAYNISGRLTALENRLEAIIFRIGEMEAIAQKQRARAKTILLHQRTIAEVAAEREARRQRELAARKAESEELRRWLVSDGIRIEPRGRFTGNCEACGGLLAWDGICIHCSR